MASRVKLTDETARKLCGLIGTALYLGTAARAVGVTPNTVYRWRRRGARALKAAGGVVARVPDKDAVFARLADGVDKALAAAEIKLLRVVQDAAEGEWRAAAWLLAHRHQSRWGDDKAELKRMAGQIAALERTVHALSAPGA